VLGEGSKDGEGEKETHTSEGVSSGTEWRKGRASV